MLPFEEFCMHNNLCEMYRILNIFHVDYSSQEPLTPYKVYPCK